MLKLGREGDSDSELASAFIEAVQKLIADVGIEPTVEKLARKDFNTIIAAAFKEANTTYAVPKYMSYDEAEQLLMALADTGMNLPK